MANNKLNIVRGHALDLIETIDYKSLDLIVTDPPYAFGGSGKEHELAAAVAVTLRECALRLKTGSWMVVFAASSWRSTEYMAESVRNILTPVRIATWCKPNTTTKCRTPGWAWASVNVIAFRKGKCRKDLEPASEVDFIVAEPIKNGRRAQVPDNVCSWAMSPYVIPGGKMLDPFAGSGALLKAAEAAGMQATGFEIQDK